MMKSRGRIDRNQIIEAAAEIADREGLQQVTLTNVASALQIRVPSLFNHVDGLNGLRRELALRGICELHRRMVSAAEGLTGEEALLAVSAAYVRFAREHPGLYEAAIAAPNPEDGDYVKAAQQVVSVLLSILQDGFARLGIEALHVARSFRSVVHGFASLEASGGFGLEVDVDASVASAIRMLIRGMKSE